MKPESKSQLTEHEIVLLFAELMWEYELTTRCLIRERSLTPRKEEAELLDRLAYYERSLDELLNGGGSNE